jgi:hypothetical protein
LAARALEPNPFFEPEFVLPAARHLGEKPVLLVVSSGVGSPWKLCAPIHARRRWRRAPTGRCWATWRHLYSFLGTPLVDRDDPEGAIGALVDWVSDRQAAGLLGLDLVDAEGPVLAAVRAAVEKRGLHLITYEAFERAASRLDDAGGLLAINRKHEREVERLGRRMAESLDSAARIHQRGDDPQAVEGFLELEASGWKGREGTALGSSPEHREFFSEMCRGFREHDRLRMLSYEAAGTPVAMLCNLKAGGALYMFKICFDERLARFSPGIQLIVASLSSLDSEPDVEMIDSCAEPTNQTINRLWAGRRRLTAVAIPAPGTRGRWAGTAVRVAARLRGRGGR